MLKEISEKTLRYWRLFFEVEAEEAEDARSENSDGPNEVTFV